MTLTTEQLSVTFAALGDPTRLAVDGGVRLWERLGADRAIDDLRAGIRPADALPPALTRLLADPDAPTLVSTLEAYLDQGGDAQGTATVLFVHRSSLAKRLRRIEDVAGVDLSCGDARLELHLGLRLRRLGAR